MTWVYLLVLVIVIVLNYFISRWFYEIAEDKGYHDRKYFWICFWFGVIGYLLVAAMPDHGNSRQDTIGKLPNL